MHQPKLCYIIYRSRYDARPSTESPTHIHCLRTPKCYQHPWVYHIKVENAKKVGTAFHKYSCRGFVSKAKQEKSLALCVHLHVLLCSLKLYMYGDSEPASYLQHQLKTSIFRQVYLVQLPTCPLHQLKLQTHLNKSPPTAPMHHQKLPLCRDCPHEIHIPHLSCHTILALNTSTMSVLKMH